eukprot:349668-Chlamydomonas_euryale.AAC.5
MLGRCLRSPHAVTIPSPTPVAGPATEAQRPDVGPTRRCWRVFPLLLTPFARRLPRPPRTAQPLLSRCCSTAAWGGLTRHATARYVGRRRAPPKR